MATAKAIRTPTSASPATSPEKYRIPVPSRGFHSDSPESLREAQ